MQEMQVDAKKELDALLKSACFSLKDAAVKSLLGAIDGFLAKVTAFIGEIPISYEGSTVDASRGAGLTAAASSSSRSISSSTSATTGTTGTATVAVDASEVSASDATGETALTNAPAGAGTGAGTAVVVNTLAHDSSNSTPLLPAADSARLKNQSFVRSERIKEMLDSVQNVLLQRVPDLKALMKVT
jgi:hypothetical protein